MCLFPWCSTEPAEYQYTEYRQSVAHQELVWSQSWYSSVVEKGMLLVLLKFVHNAYIVLLQAVDRHLLSFFLLMFSVFYSFGWSLVLMYVESVSGETTGKCILGVVFERHILFTYICLQEQIPKALCMPVYGSWRDHRGFIALKWDDVLSSKHCFNWLACDFYSMSFVICYFLSCCILSVYFNIYTALLACFSCVRTKNWLMRSPFSVCVCMCSHTHGCGSFCQLTSVYETDYDSFPTEATHYL